jgi:hypothetical protein
MRYRLNEPQVIAETVGGETIVVNLGSGHYFSLCGTAVDVWEGLSRREPVTVVVATLEGRYDAPQGAIESAVTRFVAELTAAELIVADAGEGESSAGVTTAATNGDRAPWSAPTLSVFTDMQDIILLDPVHEVDARGWPHAPAGT